MSKTRCFKFTYSNYPDTSMVDSIDCKYIIYGKEGKEPDKTDHLQGFIQVKASGSPYSHVQEAARVPRRDRSRYPSCH